MLYDEQLIEEIRSQNDIVSVISNYVKLEKKGSSYFGLCPFHNEKSPSFSVSPGKQMYYCFGCGEGGNVITFVMKYENYTFQEALKLLADRVGITLPQQEDNGESRRRNEQRQQLLQVQQEAAKYYHYILKHDREQMGYHYFHNRGLTDETILRFGLGYTGKGSGGLYHHLKQKGHTDAILKESGLFSFDERGVTDKFWNRVMFPIMDVNNRVIGFGGRVMGDAKPKYLNSPETKLFDKSRNLYGLNYARSARKKYMILCEGYMDVIALHQAGFNNAVAALGTSLTSGHASLLKRYTTEVYCTFDSDGAGVKAALRAIPILKSAGLTVRVIHLEPYKDPDEFIKALGTEAFEKRIAEAENSFLFEIHILEKNYNRNDPEEKTAFYRAVSQKLIESFPEELERNNYVEAVSNTFSIPLELLRQDVQKKALYYKGEPKQEEQAERFEKRRQKEDGVKQSQKILLTWLIEEPGLYPAVKPYISKEYFTQPLYKQVAEMVFGQLEQGQVEPARIITRFETEEEQKEAASLFHSTLTTGLSKEDKEKVLNDTVRLVKQEYLDELGRNATDITTLQTIVKEKANLQKMNIKLN
jgi:DNA primase